tara:strand:- start:2875 stop:3366 length:492 start_codon:yes stop_codon:yes gene_type:complete
MTKIYNSLLKTFHNEVQMYDNDVYKPCVVFDIDGTILVDGIYSPEDNSEIIHDVYNFLLYLQNSLGIDIFIITARPESRTNRLGTIDMLKKLGINYKYLYMWNQNIFRNHIKYKEEARKEIFENDYNVVMSLGDNYWDYGNYGGLGVHIHNDGEKIEFITDFL